jgi:2-haloacid dehalogenase
VIFDGLAIFDSRVVFSLVDALFPGHGPAVASLWGARQFEYMWLRSLSRNYADFLSVTADALVFAATTLDIRLTAANRVRLTEAWLELPCWPDVAHSLRTLKDSGLRFGFLSNMSEKMLLTGIRNCGLDGLFDHVLSTDRVRRYKPDSRAYQMAMDAFRLRRQEIAFTAAAGWDAAGARRFGYQTFWVNRQHQPAEELGAGDVAVGATLSDLVVHLRAEHHL